MRNGIDARPAVPFNDALFPLASMSEIQDHTYLVTFATPAGQAAKIDDAFTRNGTHGLVETTPSGVTITTRASIETVRRILSKIPGITDIVMNAETTAEEFLAEEAPDVPASRIEIPNMAVPPTTPQH